MEWIRTLREEILWEFLCAEKRSCASALSDNIVVLRIFIFIENGNI